MRTFKQKIGIALLVILGATAFVYYLASPAPGTIPYHLQKLGQSRNSAAWRWGPSSRYVNEAGRPVPADKLAYANPKTWLWLLEGRPTITSECEEMEKHEQALIRLGYFERREMSMGSATLDPLLWGHFISAVSNSPLTERRYMLQFDDGRPSVVRVTTCKADLPIFERVAAQLAARTNQ